MCGKIVNRVCPKFSSQGEIFFFSFYVVLTKWMLTKLIMVIILQYVQIKPSCVHLKLSDVCQLFFNKTGKIHVCILFVKGMSRVS